jgi:AraC-like DNA-binding protein
MSVETSDLDEAREVCGEHLYPRSMRLTDPSASLAARFAFLHLGALTVADVAYGAEVAGDCGEFGSYHVNIVLGGSFAAEQGRRPIHGSVQQAGVYRPVGDNVLHHSSADCHLIAVKLDKAAVEGQLAMLLDAPVRGTVRFAGQLDVSRSPGRHCAGLIRFLASEMDNPTGLVFHPIVAAPLQESLLMSVLLAVDHQYQDGLQHPVARCSGQLVARAIEAIHAEPHRPYTVAALAEIAGVSLRCLRQEFRRQVGMPPMAYLREVRMAGAHAELGAAAPDETSVAEVARRWGFPGTGHFAASYRRYYRTHPDETLQARGGAT